MNVKLVIPILLFCFCLIFISCSNDRESQKKIFRYNESTGIASLDPAFAKNQSIMWPIHQLYNTLVEINQDMKMSPSIAKSWSFSEDKKTITFELRQDVFFHNDPVFKNDIGRKLVASDVVYSLSRIINKSVASPGAWIFNNNIDSILPFVAINDSVFQLHLLQPFSPILGILSMQYCSIVAREAVENYGSDFRKHPVGTGPFCFVAWEEDQALILKKNPSYFELDQYGKRLPYLDGIKISFLESKTSEFLAFQQNKIDFINDLDPSFKNEILTRKGALKDKWNGKITLSKHPYLNTEYLGILADTNNAMLKNSPLRIKKIRKAINYGIDRNKMIFYLRNSIGYPANSGFIPIGMPSFDSLLLKGYEFNPTKAKQLIMEAGFDKDHPMPEIKLITVPNYANLGSYLVNELKQIGFNISVEVVQKSLLLEEMSKSQVSFFRGSWIADFPDEINFLGVFYGKNPAPPNYTRYHNEIYDQLFEKALTETEDSIKINLYREMEKIIIDDSPVVTLWYDMSIHLIQNNISGLITNSLNMLELRHVDKK